MTDTFDVIVSGAGPVGLFFAYQMASRGHSVCIVDTKPGPTENSRAVLVTARTMEILEGKGLAADFLYDAFIASGMCLYRNGAIVAEVDALGDTPFPHLTGLMQAVTERIFHRRIEQDTNLRVKWNTELVSYTQDDQKITAIIRNNDTKVEKIIHSSYIVGADGTHSKVRKGCDDWTYEGVAIQTKFGLVDLRLRGKDVDLLKEKMCAFMSGSSVMGIIRINPAFETEDDDHVFRVFGNLESYTRGSANSASSSHGIFDQSAEEAPTLEFVQSWINEKTQLQLEASNIIWSTYFRINERMANGFRRKRAFLIGDAAHCHSPFGGQGMNLGLQDADNLAWKLSAVLENLPRDPEALLDSYSVEREPLARATIDATSASTKVGLGGSDLLGILRPYLIPTMLMLPQLREFAFKTVSQLWVKVHSNSNILGTSSKGLIEAGTFLPPTGTFRKSYVSQKNKPRTLERKTLREIFIGNHQFTAIFIGTCPAGYKPNVHLMEKFWKDTRGYPIRRLVIQSSYHSHVMKILPNYVDKDEEAIAEASFYSEEQLDVSISLTNRVGLMSWFTSYFGDKIPPSVVLMVRPDQYIAEAKLVKHEKDLDEALTFISSHYIRSK